MRSAYGKTVSPAVAYEASFDAFENLAEMRDKGAYPSEAEILKLKNDKEKAKARQAAMNAALEAAGYEKPTLETDAQFRLETLYKVFVAAGKSPEEARAIASTTLGESMGRRSE